MKKIVLTIFAAATMFGCVKDIPITSDAEQQDVISFGNMSTRAVNSANDIDAFKVWCSITSIDYPQEVSGVPYLTNETVYRDGEGWNYNNKRRWINDSHFFFLGLYSDMSINPFTENIMNNNMVYTLDVTTPAAANLDILTAFSYINTADESFKNAQDKPAVPMSFGHLMTKVNLKIQQDFEKDPDFDYFITKVTISGVKGSGIYGLMPYPSTDTHYMGMWNFNDATITSFEKSYSTPQILRNAGAADPTKIIHIWGEEGLLLIPQAIAANGVKIRVDYLYDITPGDGDPGTTAHYVEGYLPASQDLWQSGKHINYTLKVAEQNDITFAAPSIEPWGAPQTGGTIIIK